MIYRRRRKAFMGGGFSPLDVANMELWFDAADDSTITEAGGNMSQWDDKSGNGRNAVQATGADQPLFTSDSVGNYVDFRGNGTGTGDFMTFTGPGNGVGESVFFVGELEGGLADSSISGVITTNSNLGSRSYIFLVNTNFSGYAASLDGAGSGDAGSWYKNGVFVATGQNIGVQADVETDVDLCHSFILNNGNPNSGWSGLGCIDNQGTRSFAGKFREIIVYNGQVSAADRQAVENYLMKKWGIL